MRDRFWEPALRDGAIYSRRPEVGSLIAVNRKPYRVDAVTDLPRDEWTDEHRERWTGELMPDPWARRPFHIDVTTVPGGERGRIKIEPWHSIAKWHVLPEHYAVCVSCGELAPCVAHTSMLQARETMKQLEREMQLLPGCCPACQEPITSKQQTITFPGENLLLPIGEPNVRFHLRRSCRSSAAGYEDVWVAADPTRPRSLLTLKCTGWLTVHGDGSAECHGAQGGECPSLFAAHQGVAACYVSSRGLEALTSSPLPSGGCWRDCSPIGHPGTRMAARPQSIYP